MADRNVAFHLDIDFHIINCGECGGTYALNARYARQKKEEGGSWNCPYCQVGWGYTESKIDKLKKQLENEKQRTRWERQKAKRAKAEAAHEAARANGYKGALVKTKKRVGHGVCPSCNRSFENLRRHMEAKHPDYDPEEVPEEVPHSHCEAPTNAGTPCQREVRHPDWTCWQH